MKYSEVLGTLQNLIGFIPKQATLCQVVGCNASKMSARAQRDSNFPDDEVRLIEAHFGVNILSGDDPDVIELDYYTDVNGSCGFGLPVLSEDIQKIKTTKSYIADFSEKKQYSVINAYGISMQPFIHDMDKLIVEHWQGQQIVDNRIYVFRYKDELFVKRLAKNIDEVIISSDNPDFAKKTVKADENLQIIGQIVGLIRSTK